MAVENERSPPRLVGKVMLLTFDFESWRADYRSFSEEYRSRCEQSGCRKAKLWAYGQAARGLWELIPPNVRTAAVSALIKLILRN